MNNPNKVTTERRSGQQQLVTVSYVSDPVKLRPELLMVAQPGSEGEFVVEGGYESLACMLPLAVFTAQLGARGQLDEFQTPRTLELREPSAGSCSRLFELGKHLTDAAEQDPNLLEGSERARAGAQVDLIETLLEIVCSTENPQLTARDRTRRDYSEIVKQAQERALRDLDERCYVGDLCEASGVSERTLQYAFQSIMEMTPMAYLRQLRLHRARRALREAAPDSTTVTAVALDWGFSHFGEFSRAYKDCFSELPSETLNNPKERP
ncbi:MAG: helix-turn-helix domain-containing protein [Candidatus Krumholzibacteriota bacterium]|nr:helix-turn-helix domain-containing protein [Candidatus Krumholzibacteriota bacterium]